MEDNDQVAHYIKLINLTEYEIIKTIHTHYLDHRRLAALNDCMMRYTTKLRQLQPVTRGLHIPYCSPAFRGSIEFQGNKVWSKSNNG